MKRTDNFTYEYVFLNILNYNVIILYISGVKYVIGSNILEIKYDIPQMSRSKYSLMWTLYFKMTPVQHRQYPTSFA